MSESEGWLGAAGGTGERGLRAMRGCPGAPSEISAVAARGRRMGRVRERATPRPRFAVRGPCPWDRTRRTLLERA